LSSFFRTQILFGNARKFGKPLDHEGLDTKHKDLNCGINGDALAMKEIWRVLKDKGCLILTVPYGRLIIKLVIESIISNHFQY
jgi:SAM-dependent methyltransferase